MVASIPYGYCIPYGYWPLSTCHIWKSTHLLPSLYSVASNQLGVEGGVKLAEAFAKMPNLREVKCVLAPHVHTALP
jgi:hypothetical protein